MSISIGKKSAAVFALTALIAFTGTEQVFAAKKTNAETATLQKEEDGYYYGYGKGSTKEQCDILAKKDLAENALSQILLEINPTADPVEVSEETVLERFAKAKIETVETNKQGTFITYRMKSADFAKAETAYAEKLRASITPRYESFVASKNIASKIEDASFILGELTANGETKLLTVYANSTELFATRVEKEVANLVDTLDFSISQKDGFVGPETVYSVTVKSNGKPVPELTVKATWEIASLPITVDYEGIPEIVSFVKTDSNGNATVEYPTNPDYKNKCVTLTVSTAFSTSKYATSAMRKLDAKSSVENRYAHYEDFAAAYKGAYVAPGAFMAGRSEKDTKAQKTREEIHEETTGPYMMDLSPVTNEKYAAYLFVTGNSETPEYFDNNDYNKAAQPVVGISKEDAMAYAAWLSEVTGEKYRLPTEAEWEKAARAGKDIIYPWGDDSPDKGKKASYNKNGKIKGLAPVGFFAANVNELGIVDLVGNVWEMTASHHTVKIESEEGDSESTDTDEYTVKGGSWMDGPSELRISNYKNISADTKSSEVGFRLVKDVEEITEEAAE